MKVMAEIAIYEINGIDVGLNDNPSKMTVNSHWNRNSHDGLIVINIDGKNYSVSATEMAAAIKVCSGLPR